MNTSPSSMVRSPRILLAVSLVVVSTLVLGGVASALAADGAATTTGPSLVRAAAVLGPLGISPFFALGGLGLASLLGIYTLPVGLEAFGHPLVAVLLVLAGLGLQSGRSSKLTKPLAEAAGLGESAFALIVAIALALPFLSAGGGAGPAQAGIVDGGLFLLAAGTGVAALVVLRTALDVLIWLSPFPFVDAAFQVAKFGITLLLVAAAILAPPVAIILNVLILFATFVLVRWAVRTARFGLTIVYDLTLGRRAAAEAALPRDEVIEGDLGPFRCFALEAPGLPRRAQAEIELRAGRWFLVGAGPGGPTGPDTPLGDGATATLTPTWAGVELAVGDAILLLPPRYKRHAEQIRVESRAARGERARRIPSAQARSRTRAEASAL